jgi:hypothetical protein
MHGLSLDRCLLGHFVNVLVQLEELIAGRAVYIGPPVWTQFKNANGQLCWEKMCRLFEKGSG